MIDDPGRLLGGFRRTLAKKSPDIRKKKKKHKGGGKERLGNALPTSARKKRRERQVFSF